MNLTKVAQLVKTAREMSKDEKNRRARARYKAGGIQLRKERKKKQRLYRRKGGEALKNKVKIQEKRLEFKPTRIRREPLIHRPYDRT